MVRLLLRVTVAACSSLLPALGEWVVGRAYAGRSRLGIWILTVALLPAWDVWQRPAMAIDPNDTARDSARIPLDDAPPMGATCRIGTSRFRTSNTSGALFLPDGHTIVTAGGLWNVETGKRLRDVPFEDSVRCIARSRNGSTLVTLGFKFDEAAALTRQRVQLWTDAFEPKTLVEWSERSSEPTVVTVADEERVVVVGNSIGVLTAFHSETGERLFAIQAQSPQGQPGAIDGLAIAPDGRTLAVAGRGGVNLFDIREPGAAPTFLASSGRSVRAVAFSPDGTLLAGGEDGPVAARLWDAGTGELKKTLKTGDKRHYYPSTLAFSPDGRRLIVPAQSVIEIWNVDAGSIEHALSTGVRQFRCVDVTPDGEWLVAGGSWDNVLSAWNLRTLQPVELPAGHLGGLTAIAFSPNGAVVYTASHDGTVRSWDASTGKPMHLMEHQQRVIGLAASADGMLVASSSLDDTVAVWNAQSGQQVYSLTGHGKFGGHRALAFSADSRRLLSFGDDSILRIWETGSGKAEAEHRLAEGIASVDPPRGLASLENRLRGQFSIGGSHLYLSDGRVVATADGKATGNFVPPSQQMTTRERCLSPDGKFLASITSGPLRRIPLTDGGMRILGSREHTFTVLGIADNRLRTEFRLADGGSPPVAFSCDGALAAVGDGPLIRVFETQSGKAVYRVRGLHMPASLLEFSPDGSHIAAAHGDTTVTLWPLAGFVSDESAAP